MVRTGKLLVGMLTTLLLASCQTAPKGVLATLAGGESGKIYYESTSPYDLKNILDGSRNDPRVTVFGVLTFPEGVEGKVPAMVFVHGSSGWLPQHERYLQEFNKMGVATFRTDSFTPRGIDTVVGEQVRVTEQMMMADAFNALRLLSTQPRIDPKRVGIMGASKGGAVALYTAWEPIRKAAVEDDLQFALHIPLYPPCALFETVNMTGAPVRILIGESDEWTPAKPCVELTEELKAAGYDAETIVYPDAYHGFDSTEPVHNREKAFNTTKCRFKILDAGTTIETTSGYTLETLQERRKALAACATRGVLSGRNNAAKKKVLEDVKAFVTRVFELKSAS